MARTDTGRSPQQEKGVDSNPMGNCIARLLFSTCWSACGNTQGGRRCPGAKGPRKGNKLCGGEKGKEKRPNFCEKLCIMLGMKTQDGVSLRCWCCKKKDHVHTACCCRCESNPELDGCEEKGNKKKSSGGGKEAKKKKKSKEPKSKEPKSKEPKKSREKKSKGSTSSKKVETALIVPKIDEVDPTLEPIPYAACMDCDDVQYEFGMALSETSDEESERVLEGRPSTPNDPVTYQTKVTDLPPSGGDNDSVTNVITKTLSTTQGGQIRIEQKIFLKDNRKSVIVVTHGENCECDLCKALKEPGDKIDDKTSPKHFILPNEARSNNVVNHTEDCRCAICSALKSTKAKGSPPESGKAPTIWASYSHTNITGSKDNAPHLTEELPLAKTDSKEIKAKRNDSESSRPEKHVVFYKSKKEDTIEPEPPAPPVGPTVCDFPRKKKVVKRKKGQLPKLKIEHIPIAMQESSENCPSFSELDCPLLKQCHDDNEERSGNKQIREEHDKKVSFESPADYECESSSEVISTSESSSDESDHCPPPKQNPRVPVQPCDCFICNDHIKRNRRQTDKCKECGERPSKKPRKKPQCCCERKPPTEEECLEQIVEKIVQPPPVLLRSQSGCVAECEGKCRYLEPHNEMDKTRDRQRKSFAFRAMDTDGQKKPSCWWPECCDLPTEFHSEVFHIPSADEMPTVQEGDDEAFIPKKGDADLALLPVWYRKIAKKRNA